ncbi:MAG: tRNA-specific 2-thiouridylase, partial [Desulfovibrionaceae bacterium]
MATAPCIAVAVSGGADSLYALARLSQQAPRVIALHGLFLPQEAPEPPVAALHKACTLLGLSLHVVDLRATFDAAVVQPFLQAYLAGHTPNPCAHCNVHIKFGALWEAARTLGADTLATGHYAALEQHPLYGYTLRQGQDSRKDQSYFLSLVPMERLRCALFPLADQHKPEALAYVHGLGLRVPVPKESQDICFVPQNLQDGYRTFVDSQARQRGLRLGSGGPMCLPDGRTVGQHKGLWQYTQGQRRGLGVAYAEALYVIGKDISTNTLQLGTQKDSSVQDCHTEPANFLVAAELWPPQVYVRVRYRQANAPASVHIQTNGSLHIHFMAAQQ